MRTHILYIYIYIYIIKYRDAGLSGTTMHRHHTFSYTTYTLDLNKAGTLGSIYYIKLKSPLSVCMHSFQVTSVTLSHLHGLTLDLVYKTSCSSYMSKCCS